MTDAHFPRRWWLGPLVAIVAPATLLAVVCTINETAREVVAKAVMLVAGTLATPFILEISVALAGLVIVVTINQWRLQKEGDGWVYLARTEPDSASLSAGAETPPKRLESVVLPAPPDVAADLDARLAIAEGYLELGLHREALDHLALLSEQEQNDPRALSVKNAAVR